MNDQSSTQRFLDKIGRAATGVSPPKRVRPFKKRSCCVLHVAEYCRKVYLVCWLKGSLFGLWRWGLLADDIPDKDIRG